MAAASIEDIRHANDASAFNEHCGFEVISAGEGLAELGLSWRDEFGQSSKYLHAGLIAALIDTSCGYAAGTLVGPVLASHLSVNFIRPGIGPAFVARAKVVRAGKVQVFTRCELFARAESGDRLIATGETILVPVSASNSPAPVPS